MMVAFEELKFSSGEFSTDLAALFEKHCPELSSQIPLSLRRHIGDDTLPVVMGFGGWYSLDEVRVLAMDPGSPAERSGIEPGDYILGEWDGPRFPTWAEYDAFMMTRKPGDRVYLEVWDGLPHSDKRRVRVTLAANRDRTR
jgi:C-terminal processing protease CtpA/Prc